MTRSLATEPLTANWVMDRLGAVAPCTSAARSTSA